MTSSARLKTITEHKSRPSSPEVSDYAGFDQLDGRHPWMEAVPKGYVPYQVRELRKGRVLYFNYSLAKEMGLLPLDHPHRMTKALEEKLIETFSLQIINEYDIQAKKKFPAETIKKNTYMATRYLQLQHKNKQGKTSGDGRGIWNGVVKDPHGRIWDVSSRGTGVTCLAPGSVEAGRPLRTGSGQVGYGCGLAELDELVGATLMSEVFHRQGIATERSLCIIDHGGSFGIGVRAGLNLLRPAHFFPFLKQGEREDLQKSIDYFLSRQVQNKEWLAPRNKKERYREFLKTFSSNFARFAAQLESDYIFAWLDWDGDNVLGTAGIIDYGSIRQFGLRHDQYRYDDVERWSTNLNEQRGQAKKTVQVMAQAVDFVLTGKKKSLDKFQNHSVCRQFDREFEREIQNRLLYQLGLDESQRKQVLVKQRRLLHRIQEDLQLIESKKSEPYAIEVADGLNRPALYNIRSLLRSWTLAQDEFQKWTPLSPDVLQDFAFSTFCTEDNTRMDKKLRVAFENLDRNLGRLFASLFPDGPHGEQWNTLVNRVILIQRPDRLTGNGLIQVVDEIMKYRKKKTAESSVQAILEQLISHYPFLPEVKKPIKDRPYLVRDIEIFEKLLKIIQSSSEEI